MRIVNRMTLSRAVWLVLPLWLAAAVSSARAETKLATLFGDHMVLQQNMPIAVWGTDEPNQKITVTLGTQTASVMANKVGKWMAKLSPQKAGGGPLDLTVSGSSTVARHDVLLGEVWLCSGQSNMEVNMQFVSNASQEIKAANHPDLRLFTVARDAADEPQSDVSGQWAASTPETVKTFSGTAYFFGRDLQKALGVPVGLIQSAWGGTYIESWISRPALTNDVDNPVFQTRWQKALDHYPTAVADFTQQLADYQKAADQAKAEGKPLPRKPLNPLHSDTLDGPQHAAVVYDQAIEHFGVAHPSSLWNGMIAPLIPLSIRGVVWYQGESNFTRSQQYSRLFPLMIADWRKQWGEGDFPFLFVQLPNIGKQLPTPDANQPNQWPEIREAQTSGLTQPNTAMAVTIDLGDAIGDIHPPNKAGIGGRLALMAQGVVYSQKVAYLSPLYNSMATEGDQIRIKFKSDSSGLKTTDGAAPQGFAIAGADKKWVWADAKIEGETVVISSPQVPKPVAVRYFWIGNRSLNLVNGAGLPVPTFRTDDWPISGTGKK